MNSEEFKERLLKYYPFTAKVGNVHSKFNKQEVFKRFKNEKLLVLVIGIEGSGKTTFCRKKLSEFNTINVDDILQQELEKYDPTKNKLLIPGTASIDTPDNLLNVNEIVNLTVIKKIREDLNQKGIAILDSGAFDLEIRIQLLNLLQDDYDKVILIALTPAPSQIKKRIKIDIKAGLRTEQWEGIQTQYINYIFQIDEHILELGVDDVYFVKD